MKYTEKEIKILEAMKATSIDVCGQFDEDQNMSYMNINEINALFGNVRSARGVLSSLIKKGAVVIDDDTGRNLYVAWIETWEAK